MPASSASSPSGTTSSADYLTLWANWNAGQSLQQWQPLFAASKPAATAPSTTRYSLVADSSAVCSASSLHLSFLGNSTSWAAAIKEQCLWSDELELAASADAAGAKHTASHLPRAAASTTAAIMSSSSRALMLQPDAAMCTAVEPTALHSDTQRTLTSHSDRSHLLQLFRIAQTLPTPAHTLIGASSSSANSMPVLVTSEQLCNATTTCCLVQMSFPSYDFIKTPSKAADSSKPVGHAAAARAGRLFSLHSCPTVHCLRISALVLASIITGMMPALSGEVACICCAQLGCHCLVCFTKHVTMLAFHHYYQLFPSSFHI